MSTKTLVTAIADYSPEQQAKILGALSDFMQNVGFAKSIEPDPEYQQKLLEYEQKLGLPGISFIDLLATYIDPQ